MNKWYLETGDKSDIIPSTRIRLARNLKRFPFESTMSNEQKEELIEIVQNALELMQMGDNSFRYIRIKDLSRINLIELYEKHLISPDLVNMKDYGFVAISKDDSISIMVNEEDHIRIQVLKSGGALRQSLDLANKIDDYLDSRLDYAFDEKLGFLATCPTNLGTGLRASVMIHLPALQYIKAIQQLSNTLGKLGLTIRGSYGEGTTVQGDMYTVSNQVTLGISEEKTIQNLQAVVDQIIQKEESARLDLKDNLSFIDSIHRSYGVLKHATLISQDECSSLLSRIRLGISIGVIDNVSLEQLNKIYSNYLPSSLSKYRNKELPNDELSFERAKMVKEIL